MPNQSQSLKACPIHPCEDHPIHRYPSVGAYITAMLNDYERRVDGAYIVSVGTLYHIDAAIQQLQQPIPSERIGEIAGQVTVNVRRYLVKYPPLFADTDPLRDVIAEVLKREMEGE